MVRRPSEAPRMSAVVVVNEVSAWLGFHCALYVLFRWRYVRDRRARIAFRAALVFGGIALVTRIAHFLNP